MDINDLVLSDEALSVVDEGRWMPAGDDAPGVEFLVTGMQSESARKFIRSKQAELRTKNRGKPLSEDQYSEITKEALVEHVLKDWRGLKNGGKDLPYSKDVAAKFIRSRGGKRFTLMVISSAQALDNNANDFVEKTAKN